MKHVFLLLLTFLLTSAHAQVRFAGQVIDKSSKEPILFGTVSLYQEGKLITGKETDLDGYFAFENLTPGKYMVKVSYVGYQPIRKVITLNKSKEKVILKIEESMIFTCCYVAPPPPPFIDINMESSGMTFYSYGLSKIAY